jgi:hypothetical protein
MWVTLEGVGQDLRITLRLLRKSSGPQRHGSVYGGTGHCLHNHCVHVCGCALGLPVRQPHQLVAIERPAKIST